MNDMKVDALCEPFQMNQIGNRPECRDGSDHTKRVKK